ncbi:MAG: hypothetical protein AAGC95_04910 [Pseudomonadota bacterium]
MVIFRFAAWLFVAVALMLLGADAVGSLESGDVTLRSSADALAMFGVDGAGLIDGAPAGVSQALGALMAVPGWAVLGVVGILLVMIFRPMD